MKPLPFLLCALALLSSAEERADVRFAPTGRERALQGFIEDELNRAQSRIDVALFHFTSERLARALARRRADGVRVRLLLDAAQADPEFVKGLREGKVDVRLVTPEAENARFHHKFCVLDGRIVLTGSYNWTFQGDASNHENVVRLRDATLAAKFTENFEKVWNDKRLARS